MTRRVIGVCTVIWLLLSLSLWASGWNPDIFVLGGVLVTGGVVVVVGARLARTVRPIAWPTPGDHADTAAADHERVQILLGDLDGSGRTDTTRMRERLVRMIDRRLLADHGVDRPAQPESAAELLTPQLRRLVDGTTPSLDSPRRLRAILTDIEAL